MATESTNKGMAASCGRGMLRGLRAANAEYDRVNAANEAIFQATMEHLDCVDARDRADFHAAWGESCRANPGDKAALQLITEQFHCAAAANNSARKLALVKFRYAQESNLENWRAAIAAEGKWYRLLFSPPDFGSRFEAWLYCATWLVAIGSILLAWAVWKFL